MIAETANLATAHNVVKRALKRKSRLVGISGQVNSLRYIRNETRPAIIKEEWTCESFFTALNGNKPEQPAV